MVVALGLVLAACSNGSNGSSSGGGGSSAGGGGGSSSGGGGSNAGGGSSGDVSMTIKNFSFNPGTIQGSAGQTLTIDISNQDDVEHSFTLDDDSVSQDFEGGDSGSVQVTLPDSGTVGWHCEYHPDTMKGTIEVS
jgi:plastocyanin